MKYLIIVIVFVLVMVLVLRRNILRDITERKKEDLDKKNRKEENEKKEERDKSPLAINKDILCDDGIKRVYNDFMYGIIKDRGEKIDAQLILPEDGYLVLEEGFDLNINNEKWFSETGKILNTKEILNVQKIKNSTHTPLFPASYPYISRLCCINNIYFHCSWPKSNIPEIPFSGLIDGEFYRNGVLSKKK